MLLTTQYKTNPDGKKKNITEKAIGMNVMSFACKGSGGVGFSFVWINIEMAIKIGNKPIGAPNQTPNKVSGFDKSCIQPNQGAPLISTEDNKTQ